MVIGAAAKTANLNVFGDTTVSGPLTANGGLTAAADVVIGAAAKTANLNVFGNTTVSGPLTANGGLTAAADVVIGAATSTANLNVFGNTTVSGTFLANGVLNTGASSTTNINGNLFANKGLTAIGNVVIGSATKTANLNVFGDTTVDGKISVINGIEIQASDGKTVKLTVIKKDSNYEISLAAV